MKIIGVDLDTQQQSIAMLDDQSGELVEKELQHEGEQVREFYSTLHKPVLPIFKYLAKVGKMDSDALLESFNLGVGMILVVPSAHVKKVEADLKRRREKFFQIGRIERGDTAKARVVYSDALNL
jgi:phosphoribosylformylglycinamidine cyclo-ligase